MKDLLTSKKFVAAVTAALVAFLSNLYGIEPDQALLIVGPLVAYVLGQGLADLGKERAKIERYRND
jgi:hypothetical protein